MDKEGEYAIKLIEVNASGKYVLSEEGKAFISKIQGPIAVISVAGMYRTGKSYLLNRMLLNRSNGFGVGPTVNPCTKGLWCWGRTISGKTPDGQPVNVIIIDTQGIGALDEDQTHDTRIFTLAILSASSFIYNSTGSIDQNALQNLSLVVNLTKNIQLNTTQSEEEQDDPQELAQYFPAFFWVVRDFSLQLINSDGDQITPKQYLQRALAPQKGFSDDIEEKNRIRRLLSSFFKQRQCFTLVRPLVDEKKLQNLDQLDLEQLRPQFIDQVMNFRRRILGRVRPKMFKGKELDGPMYLCLLNSYVNAINNGAVPNIQNAWNYMCQEKCAQAFEESLYFFHQQTQKNLKSVFPAEQQFLLNQLKQLKEKACDLFQTNSVGDKTKFHLKELRQKLEHKIELLRAENQQYSQNVLKTFFKKNIVQIQNKLRLREYVTFQDFMKQLNQFYTALLQNGPDLPKKDIVFLSMLRKVIPTAAQIFLKDKSEQFKTLKALTDQKQINLQFIVDQLKKEAKQAEEQSKEKITKLDREKIQLNLQVEQLKKLMEEQKRKSLLQQEKLHAQAKQSHENNKKRQQSLGEKILVLNQQISKLNGDMMTMKCEQQKQSALITLKNKQLQAQLEEIKKKQIQSMLSLRNLELSNNQSLKQLTQQYEIRIKDKEIEARQSKLRSNDLEQQLKALDEEFRLFKSEKQLDVEKLKLNLAKKEAQLTKISKQKEEFENQSKKISQSETEKLNIELIKNSQKIADLEKKLKNQVDQFSDKQRNYETQLGLLKQSIQFSQIEISEYKSQISKMKRQHQEKVAILMQQNSERQNQSKKIAEQSEIYEAKITQLKLNHQILVKKMSVQIQKLTKQLAQSQSETKSNKCKLQVQIDQQKKIIQQITQQLSQKENEFDEKIQFFRQQWRTKEKVYIQKISKLDEQLQQCKDEMMREQKEQHDKSQQTLLQLKNYYEIEKQKLDSKITNQKEKYERKISQLKAEHEERLREEVMQLQSDIQYLKEKYADLQDELVKQKTNRKIQVDIKTKMIENLEKTNQEMKSKIDNKEVQLLNKIDRLQKQHSSQKESLYVKIEQLLTKQSKIEKQRSGINHSKEQLEKLILIKEKSIQQLKQQLKIAKNKIEQEKEAEKTFRNGVNTKMLQQRVEFQKKMALLEQQNEYLKIKIDESEKSNATHQQSQEDKFKKLKQDYNIELKTFKQKSQSQLQSIELKHEKLKKQTKQKQGALQKSINQLEKQLIITQQKLMNSIQKLKVYEEKQLGDTEQYNLQFSSLKQNLSKEKEQLREQLQIQQKERERLQNQKNKLISSYQHEKILNENKVKYLQESKQRYRAQNEETIKKLETIIDGNKKKWSQEKANLQLTHSDYISKLEKKFWKEKQELSENVKKQESEYQNKIRSLEGQNRSLSERLALEEQNKIGSQNISDRRLKQITDNEKKLQQELERLKATRQSEQLQLQNKEKEKQNLKTKIKQKQDRLIQAQKLKQSLRLQLQRQKLKWNYQAENSNTKIEDLKQMIKKYEKDIDKLQRQNEKYKVERKCQKTSMPSSMNRFSGNFNMDRGLSRSSLEQSVLKQNSNNTSQMSIGDTSLFFKE